VALFTKQTKEAESGVFKKYADQAQEGWLNAIKTASSLAELNLALWITVIVLFVALVLSLFLWIEDRRQWGENEATLQQQCQWLQQEAQESKSPAHVLASDAGNDLRPNLSPALYKGRYAAFRAFGTLYIRFLAKERFIHFHNAGQSSFIGLHGVPDTMGHEPCGFIRHSKHPVKLMGGNGFLAGAKEEYRHAPLGKGNLAVGKDGSNHNGELSPTSPAFVQPLASRRTAGCLGGNYIGLGRFAMGTNGAVRPAKRFHELASLILICVFQSQLGKGQFFVA
jgi:hypothetical protein